MEVHCPRTQSMAVDLAQSELAHVKFLQSKLGGVNNSALAHMPQVRCNTGTHGVIATLPASFESRTQHESTTDPVRTCENMH